jgi:Skp family chaperone for outer membrane proteins
LAAEFKKPQDELDAAAKQLQSLQDEVAKLQNSPSADPKIVQAKMAQIDQVTKDSQRKLEDTKASYQTRRTNLLTPLQEDVGKALDAFAKTHGITMIIDGSQVPGVIYAADTLDITKVFISEYTSKNPPAAATAATP